MPAYDTRTRGPHQRHGFGFCFTDIMSHDNID